VEWNILLQSWNEHYFVLTSTHLYYTEEQQQQDTNDADDEGEEDEVFAGLFLLKIVHGHG